MSESQINTESAAKDKDPKDHPRQKVEVTVDRKEHRVRSGLWVVSDFKREVKVEAEKALDQVIDGQFKPLDDGESIEIKGGEVFVSHARQGGSA